MQGVQAPTGCAAAAAQLCRSRVLAVHRVEQVGGGANHAVVRVLAPALQQQ